MIDVDVNVDTRDMDRGLDAMVSPRVLAATARALKKPMRADQRDHAKQAEGPDGKWPSRKKVLGRGKGARRRNRRKLLGRLPQATIVTAGRDVVTAASRAKWSAAHQEGARVGRGAKLPARPFLWISDGLMTAAAEELRNASLEAFGR